jgi:hypothetical protein
VKIKSPNFEKELSFLVPYLLYEETRRSDIAASSILAHAEFEMDEVSSNLMSWFI